MRRRQPLLDAKLSGEDPVTMTSATSAQPSTGASLAAAPAAGQAGSPLRVALLGCGVVGSEVARLLTEQAVDLQARVGRPLELVGIGVRRLNRARPGIDPSLFTTDV